MGIMFLRTPGRFETLWPRSPRHRHGVVVVEKTWPSTERRDLPRDEPEKKVYLF